jgi:uncharacterized protein (DUF2267 family)
MAHRADQVWRLPNDVTGKDTRLPADHGASVSATASGSRFAAAQAPAAEPMPGSNSLPVSASVKTRLRRMVSKTPEVMVKVTGRSRGMAGHLQEQLNYITRNGRLPAETQDGQRIVDRDRLRVLHDEWLLANAAEARGRSPPDAAQSVTVILSMPPGTPADPLEAAARAWTRDTFQATHDWLMARHDDTDHPHVHVVVRAVGRDGRRLAPSPDDLQQWRERFARELRHRGVEAEATPRQARGAVRKADPLALRKAEQRGLKHPLQEMHSQVASLEATSPEASAPSQWSRDLQDRQASIRQAYLTHADALLNGSAADRELARDIRRFVANMPVTLTRQQAMTVELRQVLHQQNRREVPPMIPLSAPRSCEGTRPNILQRLDDVPLPTPAHHRSRH